MRVSPTEPGPGDTPAGIPVDAPVPWPGERGHDIEPVRPPIVVRPVTPRPSGVLHLDPEVLLADFGAHGERAPVPGGAVHNRVGRQFSEATRIASSARGPPPSHPASADRAIPTCRGSAG